MKIKTKPREFFSVWKQVFGKWQYLMTVIAVFLVFYSANVLIRNLSIVRGYLFHVGLFQSLELFLILFVEFKDTMTTVSFVSLILIGLLFGVFIGLIVYKTKMLKNVSGNKGIFATVGIFLGVLASGCAACGIGLLSVFGISAAVIALLPFKGIEFSILAVGLLSFSIIEITKNIKKGIVCEIQNHRKV